MQEALEHGRKASLTALRDTLAHAIDECTDAKDLAALALRFTRVLAELDELAGPAHEEDNDLAERRRSKLSAATGT